MTGIIERAFALWQRPSPDDAAALATFRGVYADPVVVNGVETPLGDLVTRARALSGAFDELHVEVLERLQSAERTAFAFRLSGRHVGPLTTPLGVVAPTGRDVSILGMDLFVMAGDRVAAVWAVADYLGLLIAAGHLTAA